MDLVSIVRRVEIVDLLQEDLEKLTPRARHDP